MKKILALFAVVFGPLLSAAPNLLKNPDFSDGMEHWTVRKTKNAKAFLNEEKDSHSLCLATENKPGENYVLVCSTPVKLIAGYPYELKMSFQADGLRPADMEWKRSSSLYLDFFITSDQKGIKAANGTRLKSVHDSKVTRTLSGTFKVGNMPGNLTGHARIQLQNRYENNPVTAKVFEVSLAPLDRPLENGNFEDGKETPAPWSVFGGAVCKWVDTPVHSGKKAISVSDAPEGVLSGWSVLIPVRGDRSYNFKGYAKGGDLNPDGFIGGGAIQIQFLDEKMRSAGKPVVSEAVPANTDWKALETGFVQPPVNAQFARLTAGLNYCRGTAYFDDLALVSKTVQMQTVKLLKRTPVPDQTVTYAKNLLFNGSMEEGKNGKIAGWHYVGKSDKDWTEAELNRFYDNGRPDFKIGRGRGEWSTDDVYAGNHSLLNISIEPPLAKKRKWHGMNPVAGEWHSDHVPCTPGKAYIAGGWIKPGREIRSSWEGPLKIYFFDKKGRQVKEKQGIRTKLYGHSGVWNYWSTMPYLAPENAETMCVCFGQELQALIGGWGMVYADNVALWEAPNGLTGFPADRHTEESYREWFVQTHEKIKPPYMPSPVSASEYVSAIGSGINSCVGNIFYDPNKPVKLKCSLFNQLGEKREVRLKTVSYDAYGEIIEKAETKPFILNGYSKQEFEFEQKPAKAFGAYFVDCTIMEGDCVVGTFFCRYGILSPERRKRTVENPFAVTTLAFPGNFFTDEIAQSPFSQEMMKCLQIAGFGKVWVRLRIDSLNPQDFDQMSGVLTAQRFIEFHKKFGMETLFTSHVPFPTQKHPRTLDSEAYYKIGQNIGRVFGNKVPVIGNHGIEQANSASGYRGNVSVRLTDEEYDTIMARCYDGIKSTCPTANVCIGNIATDFDGKTVSRLYNAPGNGKFDGAVFNAYMGLETCCQSMLRIFDSHGDKHKIIWSEEQCLQRSPISGPDRRYLEINGAKRMVASWISPLSRFYPRLKCMTMWRFVRSGIGGDSDICMMDFGLQPRPQFIAHAVMADFLADAVPDKELSSQGICFFEWKRTDGPVQIIWAESGKQTITLEVPTGSVSIMDIMGNVKKQTAQKGLVSLEVTDSPVFLSGGGNVRFSKRVEVSVFHGTRKIEHPELGIRLKNNTSQAVSGTLTSSFGKTKVKLESNGTKVFYFPLPEKVSPNVRTYYDAVFSADDGSVFAGSANFTTLAAVKATVKLDGTWDSWSHARVVTIGRLPAEQRKNGYQQECYTGEKDLLVNLRLAWDQNFLYLGVEALDDVFLPQIGKNEGFMGDSIEFAIQTEGLLNNSAKYHEYEMFLPMNEKDFVLNRRMPFPQGPVTGWHGLVKPTGERGNVNYQLAIPWKDLNVTPQTGKRLSFSILVNDKDLKKSAYSGKRSGVSFFDGINGKNPGKFGDLLLTE